MADWYRELELTQPAWLFALAVLPILAWYHRKSLVDFSVIQRRLSLALRIVIVVLLVLSLAGLTLLRPVRDLFVVFVVDNSLSVGDEARQAREKFFADAMAERGTHKTAYLEFAKSASAFMTERAEPKASPDDVDGEPESAERRSARRGTNIAQALDAAVAGISPGYVPRLVLITDGNETEGDALRVALGAGVRVDTVALPSRTEPRCRFRRSTFQRRYDRVNRFTWMW